MGEEDPELRVCSRLSKDPKDQREVRLDRDEHIRVPTIVSLSGYGSGSDGTRTCGD